MKTITSFLAGRQVSNLTAMVAAAALIVTAWAAKSGWDRVSQISEQREQELRHTSTVYNLIYGQRMTNERLAPPGEEITGVPTPPELTRVN